MVSKALPESRYTASTGLTWSLLSCLRDQGVAVVPMVHQLGLRLRDLMSNPEARMPLSQLHALWLAAAQASADPALGIRCARISDPQSSFSWPAPFALHEHISRAAVTLRDGIVRQAKYLRLMRDGYSVQVEESRDVLITRFEFASEHEPRALIDFHMAAGLLLTRRVSDNPHFMPVETWFKCQEPADIAPYRAFFGDGLRFAAECDAIVAAATDMDRPLPTANLLMLEALEQRARNIIEELPAIDDFIELVREHIAAELPSGNTNASCVSEKLGMSPRTLHRRLQTAGTSYQDLLDNVRCRLATRHLASRKHTINEVAALVGFAQPSAFHRAFKSWTGETPADYQERFIAQQAAGSAGRASRSPSSG